MWWLSLWGCGGAPSCDDTEVVATDGEETVIRAALAEYNTLRESEVCVAEVVVGERTAPRRSGIGLKPSGDLRAQIFHDLCYLEDQDDRISTDEAFNGVGLRGSAEHRRRVDLARACGRFGAGEIFGALTFDSCGQQSTAEDRATGQLFSQTGPPQLGLGTELRGQAPETLGGLATLGLGHVLYVVTDGPTRSHYVVRDELGTEVSEILPNNGPVEVYSGVSGALIRQGGRMYTVGGEQVEPFEPFELVEVAGVGSGMMAEGSNGWWWLSSNGEELRQYGFGSGAGDVIEAPPLSAIFSSRTGLWWLHPDGRVEQPRTGIYTQVPDNFRMVQTSAGQLLAEQVSDNDSAMLTFGEDSDYGWIPLDSACVERMRFSVPGGEEHFVWDVADRAFYRL